MTAVLADSSGGVDQQSCSRRSSFPESVTCGVSSGESPCCNCGQVMAQLDGGQGRVRLGQVLLVFFLPLACAAALVIFALRYLPILAGRPGYLLLAAFGVAGAAIGLAGIFTRGTKGRSGNN